MLGPSRQRWLRRQRVARPSRSGCRRLTRARRSHLLGLVAGSADHHRQLPGICGPVPRHPDLRAVVARREVAGREAHFLANRIGRHHPGYGRTRRRKSNPTGHYLRRGVGARRCYAAEMRRLRPRFPPESPRKIVRCNAPLVLDDYSNDVA